MLSRPVRDGVASAPAVGGAQVACSVIVPTYRRPERLAATLQALAAQDLPRDAYEVLVVDDGGGVPLEAVLQACRGALNLTLLTEKHAGPAAARNAGIAAAHGTLLAFTDDDCLPDPGWLRALIDAHGRRPGAFLGGRTHNALPHNPYAAARHMLIEAVYAWYNVDPEHPRFFASNNFAAPTDQLCALGGFDADHFPFASEDRDLCARWLASGPEMAYVPQAIVRHAHSLTLRGFWRQHLAYGRGAWRFRAARARYQSAPSAAPSAPFFVHLLRYPWQHARGAAAVRNAALLALSQLASGLGLALEAVRSLAFTRPTAPRA